MKLTLQEAQEIMARSDGSLDLSKSQYAQLPEGLSVPGDLNLHRAKISVLPEGLSVGGNLNLRWMHVTELPDDLSVSGNLDLQNPTIAALPAGLSVGRKTSSGRLTPDRRSVQTSAIADHPGLHAQIAGEFNHPVQPPTEAKCKSPPEAVRYCPHIQTGQLL